MNDEQKRKSLITLENFIPYRLATLSNKVSSAIADAYAERFDLNIPQWRIFCILAEHPGLSAREVAEKTMMDKVAVSRAVNQLLERGLIGRNFDSGDRRRSILELSESGFNVYNEVAPYAIEYESKLLAGMNNDELENFDKVIRALNKAADDIRDDEKKSR